MGGPKAQWLKMLRELVLFYGEQLSVFFYRGQLKQLSSNGRARKAPGQGEPTTIQNATLGPLRGPQRIILLSLGSPWAGSFLAATIFR